MPCSVLFSHASTWSTLSQGSLKKKKKLSHKAKTVLHFSPCQLSNPGRPSKRSQVCQRRSHGQEAVLYALADMGKSTIAYAFAPDHFRVRVNGNSIATRCLYSYLFFCVCVNCLYSFRIRVDFDYISYYLPARRSPAGRVEEEEEERRITQPGKAKC